MKKENQICECGHIRERHPKGAKGCWDLLKEYGNPICPCKKFRPSHPKRLKK